VALSEAQLATLSELVSATYAETSSAWAGVQAGKAAGEIAAIEGRLTSIITDYEAVKGKHLRMSGGRDGIDIDYERNRGALRSRARRLLGMSALSDRPAMFTLAGGGRGG
jgi:hypothetical protein